MSFSVKRFPIVSSSETELYGAAQDACNGVGYCWVLVLCREPQRGLSHAAAELRLRGGGFHVTECALPT